MKGVQIYVGDLVATINVPNSYSVSRQLLMTIHTRDHISVLESLLDFILVLIDSLTTMYFNDNT